MRWRSVTAPRKCLGEIGADKGGSVSRGERKCAYLLDRGIPVGSAIDFKILKSSSRSVAIQRFLSTLRVNLEGAPAEALDGRQNIIGRLGPAQRLRVVILVPDERLDGGDQLFHRLVSAPFDLLLGEEGEEPLDLIDP